MRKFLAILIGFTFLSHTVQSQDQRKNYPNYVDYPEYDDLGLLRSSHLEQMTSSPKVIIHMIENTEDESKKKILSMLLEYFLNLQRDSATVQINRPFVPENDRERLWHKELIKENELILERINALKETYCK